MIRPVRSLRRLHLPIIAGGVLLFLAGCADDAPLDTLEPQGPSAEEIDSLSNLLFVLSGIVFVLIFGACAIIFTRYRVKDRDDDAWPDQVHGNNTLEIGWTIAPAVLMAVIGVLTLAVLFDLFDTEANAITVDTGVEEIEWEPHVVVVGQQWWWEYRYYFDDADVAEIREAVLASEDEVVFARDLPPADIVTSGQMVIPAGQEVELSITARDVIHSHWIPALNGKRDAVPNRLHQWKLESDNPGVFFGQCTEYCGLSHSRMRMQVIALDPSDFQTWVSQQLEPAGPPSLEAADWLASVSDDDPANDLPAPEATPEERGLVAFTQNCASCHLIEGVNGSTYTGANQVSGAAPNLTHFASRTTFAGAILDTYEVGGDGSVRFNANDMARWLRNPESVKAMDPDGLTGPRGMPNLGLDEDTIDDLIAYLETLGTVPGGEEVILQSIVE
ncbi:MAG: cytochrome c oxidase subunit II [Acidimicrobiia bacterium]|nr:cytochrome c oxidase subunit II [Acidimicrobiia bacterium]